MIPSDVVELSKRHDHHYEEQKRRFEKAHREGPGSSLNSAWWDHLYLTISDMELAEVEQHYAAALAQFAKEVPHPTSLLQFGTAASIGYQSVRIDIFGFTPSGAEADRITRERAVLTRCLEDNGLFMSIYYEIGGWQATHGAVTLLATTP
ncbi:MAG TPA: hypothetical protein VNG90_01045 [Candidatus Acidoferrum sp.]|nr:hypothetical protein [Candidatus Acidoferrum sp.]